MYFFLAHYINMDTDTETTKKIEFDGQFAESEIEIYLFAMTRAYKMKKENELFSSLEFIYC